MAGDSVVLGGLALLNVLLAIVVARAGRRPAVTPALIALFLLNAATALALALGLGPGVEPRWLDLAFLFNMLSLVPLLLLPFVFPWRRLPARGEVVFVAVGLALVLLPWLGVQGIEPPLGVAGSILFWSLLFVLPAVGALVLLASYLGARSVVPREEAKFFLGVFALKVGVFASPISSWLSPAWLPQAARSASPDALVYDFAAEAAGTFLRVVIVAIPLAMIAAAVRERRLGVRRPRALRDDGFVLALLALGLAFPTLQLASENEYLLLRPILLAYGLLQFQLLDVDILRHRAAVIAIVVIVTGTAFVAIASAAQAAGATVTVGLGVGLTVAVALGAMLLWPFAGALLSRSADAMTSRRLLVYRSTLEATMREGRVEAAAASLRALREELGVSDREHALLVAALSANDRATATSAGDLFLERYRVVRQLGRGGGGEVFLARDERLNRDVAVKRVRPDRALTPAGAARFEREVRLASSLSHPNIVAVYDMERVGQETFLVMEHVSGGSLEDRVRAGPLAPSATRRVASDLLTALGALHERGVLHRDVKPSNVLIALDGGAKLADFGVAEVPEEDATVSIDRHRGLGTLRYMSPEQAKGQIVGPASDLYSAALTIYEALTGAAYVASQPGESAIELRMRVAAAAPFARDLGVHGAWTRWFARALDPDPAARFASAREMADALDAALAPAR